MYLLTVDTDLAVRYDEDNGGHWAATYVTGGAWALYHVNHVDGRARNFGVHATLEQAGEAAREVDEGYAALDAERSA